MTAGASRPGAGPEPTGAAQSTPPPDPDRIANNVAAVRERMATACARSGRDPADVTLVAVTKTVGLEAVRALRDVGLRDFGENRVPDGLAKASSLGDPAVRWHLIGHLQRNKASKALKSFRIIHSVESPKLIEVLTKHAMADDPVRVLLEVNISGEAAKYGLAPEGVADLARRVLQTPALRLDGLMTMAPWVEPEATRPVFRGLRELRDRLQDELGAPLPVLSMGMSNDYEIAIEEGATWVRVGSALFR